MFKSLFPLNYLQVSCSNLYFYLNTFHFLWSNILYSLKSIKLFMMGCRLRIYFLTIFFWDTKYVSPIVFMLKVSWTVLTSFLPNKNIIKRPIQALNYLFRNNYYLFTNTFILFHFINWKTLKINYRKIKSFPKCTFITW